ncbi:MAG: hypothetical protein F6J87_12535 [Spirulina sp. SIO3F2]|nr:hypothetical protein [Spirulina sp. SIO3F2]
MRNLTPPLSVGVLGGWGSGKSFVMHLMQQYLSDRAQKPIPAKQAWGDEPSPYVGHIYQIYFNSWTYAKADLWSSLMQTIFYELNQQLTIEQHLRETIAIKYAITQLFDGTDPLPAIEAKQQERKNLSAFELFLPKTWQTLADEAWEQNYRQDFQDAAQCFFGDRHKLPSHSQLQTIWQAAQDKANAAVLAGGELWRAVDSQLTSEARDQLIESNLQPLGLLIWREITAYSRNQGVIWQELSDLRQRDRDELAAIEKNLSKVEADLERQMKQAELSAQQHREGEQVNIIWQPVLNQAYRILGIEPEKVENVRSLLQLCRQSPKRILLGLGALLGLVTIGASAVWAQRVQAFAAIARFYIQHLFVSAPITIGLLPKLWSLARQYLTGVQQAQAKLEQNYQVNLQKAQNSKIILKLVQDVEQLQLQAEQKRRQVGLLASQSSLLDFVNNRLQEGSYEKRLGLIHQVSHDLQGLSQRLVTPQQGKPQAHIQDLFPRGPARVVLYIDDLDRCPPDRVVDVLEAVQLLINTPLFIVVLALDDRYIARALETAYQGVLKRRGNPSGIDYLEKIIQIPYRTRPITGDALKDYLRATIGDENIIAPEKEETIAQTDIQLPTSEAPEQESEPILLEDEPERPDSEQQLPEVVKFTTEELDELWNYCREVDLSPRTAKRLINIYKILKIIWFRSQRDRHSQAKDIQKVILIMLVLSGRYPIFIRDVFAEIARFYEERAYLRDEALKNQTLSEYFNPALNPSLLYLNSIKDPYLRREAEKFKNDVNKLIKPMDLKLLDLEESNFNLALSFCFIGDIGYDPEDYQSLDND